MEKKEGKREDGTFRCEMNLRRELWGKETLRKCYIFGEEEMKSHFKWKKKRGHDKFESKKEMSRYIVGERSNDDQTWTRRFTRAATRCLVSSMTNCYIKVNELQRSKNILSAFQIFFSLLTICLRHI